MIFFRINSCPARDFFSLKQRFPFMFHLAKSRVRRSNNEYIQKAERILTAKDAKYCAMGAKLGGVNFLVFIIVNNHFNFDLDLKFIPFETDTFCISALNSLVQFQPEET